MALEDYVAFQKLMGLNVVQVKGTYWCEVRPFFYRPLPMSQVIHQGSTSMPFGAKFCGAQYAVPPEAKANSFLNRLSFENNGDYSLDSLQRNWKRKVRLASKDLIIRPILTASEFKQAAHPAYLSFYERTRYKVRSERRDPAYFANWTDALYRIPNILVLGGFRDRHLGGVSLTFLKDRTLFYATFFCDDDSLKLHLPDLMLHAVRESAAASPDISEVFASMYKGGNGLDAFYVSRGAKIVRQPAHLELNPLAGLIIRNFFPRQYAQLLGQLADVPAPASNAEGPESDPTAPTAPPRPNHSSSSNPNDLDPADLPPRPRL